MIKSIQAFFRMFTQLFVAGEKGANALVNCATVAELSSEQYMRREQAKLAAMSIEIIEAEQPKQISA